MVLGARWKLYSPVVKKHETLNRLHLYRLIKKYSYTVYTYQHSHRRSVWGVHRQFEWETLYCFILSGWWPGGTLYGGLAEILPNNMVISPWQGKHASVCLCIPHKRTAHSFSLIHKQRQTSPLLCRLLLFLLLLFFSIPLWAKERRTHTVTPEQAWRSFRPHTEQCEDLFLAFFLFYLIHVYFLPAYLPAHFTLSHPKLDRGRVEAMCPMLHVFIATLAVCLRVLMWTVEKMVTWYDIWACETTQSARPWTQGVQALFFNASAVPRVSELNEINPPLSQYLWLEVSCVTSRWKTGCANRVSLYD